MASCHSQCTIHLHLVVAVRMCPPPQDTEVDQSVSEEERGGGERGKMAGGGRSTSPSAIPSANYSKMSWRMMVCNLISGKSNC